MGTVTERVDAFPCEKPIWVVRRQEDLLLAEPLAGPMKLWHEHDAVEAAHFAQEYVPQRFAPPRGVYENGQIRLEWQTMDNRQPFYHRNCDVDELSYQIWGERTLMTELGTAEHSPGDFSRIPVGVAHDNYGRKESHLLFYLAAAEELQPPARTSELRLPPFPSWEPAPLNELVTDGLGKPGRDLACFPIDERMLLEQAGRVTERLNVMHPEAGAAGTSWLFRSETVRIGRSVTDRADGREYWRHRDCDEVQYQISGHRTLVTQRGVLHLEPGDFARIPTGVAFTSITAGPSAHITVLSTEPLPPVAAASKKGERLTTGELDDLRHR